MKIAFVCNWGESSTSLLDRYRKQTPRDSGKWNDIEGITDPAAADFIVAMDGSSGKYPGYKTMFFQREPENIKKRTPITGAMFDGNYDNFYQISNWWIEKPFDELLLMERPEKKKNLSCVMSRKVSCDGHRTRLNFLKKLSSEYGEEIDVYGIGLRDVVPKNSYRGALFGRDKTPGLIDYRYSLACENVRIDNYFTEKLVDCFLTWTKPIYWGSPNIGKYFPSRSFELVDIRDKDSSTRVIDISKKLVEKEDIEALKEARDLVLNRYNIWPSIEKVLKKCQIKFQK